MALIQHGTLVADTVTTITFTEDIYELEVVNVDGAAAIYYRVGGTDPTVEGENCFVLPGAICSDTVKVNESEDTVIKLISAGTPKFSLRGM